MIFHNHQLMKTGRQLRLYLVSNPVAFSRYEDHRAALEVRLHELIDEAIREKENPVALIEEYLQTTYNGAERQEEMADFIIGSPQMTHAMSILKDQWDQLDETLPEDSLRFGSGTSREEAVGVFSEITLRSYLEALSGIYDE